MDIDYFCYSIPNRYESDYDIKGTDDENTKWVKIKELELINGLTNIDRIIFYDRLSKKFYNGRDEINISSMVLFPRAIIPYEDDLLNAIKESNGISLQTLDDKNKIERWPKYIKPEYRFLTITNFKEFKNNVNKYKEKHPRLFIKTVKKSNVRSILESYGEICINSYKLFYSKPNLFLDDSDEIIISEVFEHINDYENDMDCFEYRAFIINGKLASISRSYIDYSTFVPNIIIEFVNEQIDRINKIDSFPKNYVLDVGQMIINDKKVIDIIEFNPISSSGLEVSNDLINGLKDSFSSQLKLIKKQ